MPTQANLPDVAIPQLDFLPVHKTMVEMNRDGDLQNFMEVWLDTGSALVDAFVIAQHNQTNTVGTGQVAWLKRANKLDMELQRHQRMMVELRGEKVIVQPPSVDTVAKVDAVTKAVGALQLAQAKGNAALSAVTAALDIAQQVQAATKTPSAAAAPA